MKNLLASLATGLSSIVFATATSACPIGSVALKGNGWEGCSLLPDSGEPEKPKWVSRWGAIAVDAGKPAMGASHSTPSKKRAERDAIDQCRKKGGTKCEIEIAYYNQRVSMVTGDGAYFVQTNDSESVASARGMERCSDAQTGCRVFYSACSLSERAR